MSSICDSCEAPATRMWKEYPMCESCWVDMSETEADRAYAPVCEECHHKPATEIFNRLDGVSLDLCDDCFGMADHEPISSNLCDSCFICRADYPIRHPDGRRMYICSLCWETKHARKAPIKTICEDCNRKWSMIVVTKDERTTIDVCEGCYETNWAPKKVTTRPHKDGDMCSACYDVAATIEWDCEDDGRVYPFCDACWKELEDGAEEMRKTRPPRLPIMCELCTKRPWRKSFYSIHGGGEEQLLCDACYKFSKEEEESSCCDSCGSTDDIVEWESSDKPGAKVYKYCNDCLYKEELDSL